MRTEELMTDFLSMLRLKRDKKRDALVDLNERREALIKEIEATEVMIEAEERERGGANKQRKVMPRTKVSSPIHTNGSRPGPTMEANKIIHANRAKGITFDELFKELARHDGNIKRKALHTIVGRQVNETKKWKMVRKRLFPVESESVEA
jgi:hypothetical protein